MGFPSRQPVHARHCDGSGRGHDPRQAEIRGAVERLVHGGLICGLIWGLLSLAAAAESVRIATYNPELTRAGPGLLLRDIQSGQDPAVEAVVTVLGVLDADVILLTGIDYDLGGQAARALAARAGYPHVQALRGNTGVATGLDLDGDGRIGEAHDAMGYGRFAGAAGMAVLSRHRFGPGARDFGGLLWADLPGAVLPADMTPAVRAVQRLSTSGHWEVPIEMPGAVVRLLCWYATPPVFDGPEDRNGLRNHDETAFWLRLLDGSLRDEGLQWPPPEGAFVLLGQPNLDPLDGEGVRATMTALLDHPTLHNTAPRGSHGRTEPGQRGDAALDTALYDFGGLRVEVVLPSSGLKVAASGVLWPPDTDPFAAVLAAASRHRPVWVDVLLP